MTDKIGRVLTAMVTPFDENEEVDYGQAKRLALALLDSGSDGVVITGTTGESPALDWEESLNLYREVKLAVGDRGVVIAGTGSNNRREAVRATREVEKTGVDGVLLVVPYYNKPTQEGLYRHFEGIADSTSLPCILYNVPSRTVTNMTAETTIRLSQVPNIIGIKEASGNMRQVAEIISKAGDEFPLWSGNDGDTFHIVALGGYGVVSVASHLVGIQIKKMIDLIVAEKIRQASKIHLDLLPLIDALFLVSNPIPVKYTLNLLGFPVGKPRLPLTDPEDEPNQNIAAQIRNVVGQYRIDLPIPKGGD